MGLVSSISRTINHGLVEIDHTIKKIITEPSATKKVLQIADKIFAAYDLAYHKRIKDRKITEVIKGSISLIGFYSSYKNFMFWIHPFSKETLDSEALRKSLCDSLCHFAKKGTDRYKERKRIAENIFSEVVEGKAYYSKNELRDAIEKSLEEHKISKNFANSIIIQQKKRPLPQVFAKLCLTITDLADNLLTLKKWQVLDLSRLAASIGSQSKVFAFVLKIGANVTLGIIASAGLAVLVGAAAYQVIQQTVKYTKAKEEEKEGIYKQLCQALLDFVSNGADLICTLSPLFFAINPPIFIALAIFAKGTGLIAILIRSKG